MVRPAAAFLLASFPTLQYQGAQVGRRGAPAERDTARETGGGGRRVACFHRHACCAQGARAAGPRHQHIHERGGQPPALPLSHRPTPTAASRHVGQVGGARRGGTLLHSVSRYFHATMRCFGVDFGADAPAMGGGAAAGGGAATPLQLVEALGAFRDKARNLVRSRMEIHDACSPPPSPLPSRCAAVPSMARQALRRCPMNCSRSATSCAMRCRPCRARARAGWSMQLHRPW